jgi:3-dehydroquinate synthase
MMAWPREAGIAADAAPRLVAHMLHDKKRTRDGLPFVLARGLGDSFLAKDVPLDAVEAFLAADLAVDPKAGRKAA